MSESTQTAPSSPPPPKGPIGRTLSVIGKVIGVLILSLFLSIFIEWLGMNFWWPDERRTHAQDILKAEIGYLNQDFKESVITSSPVQFVNDTAGYASDVLFEKSGINGLIAKANHLQHESGFYGGLSRFYLSVADYVLATIAISQLFLVRLSIMVLSLPLFLLFVLVGVSEGLMQRDLRRWGGGRESGFVYHHAKGWIVPVFLLSWVVYLSLPFSIHPNLILVPFAVLLGVNLYIGVSRFKKYL